MNMDYCRFRNTLEALDDCNDEMNDDELSEKEECARKKLVALCCEIAERAERGEL